MTASLILLVYGLTRATVDGWADPVTVAALAGSALLVAAFVGIEHRAAAPLLPLRMFRARTLVVANVVTVIVASIAFSQFFLLTLYLQQVLHYSAVEAGLAFLPIAGTIAVVSNIAQGLVTRLGPRRVLTGGLLLAAAAEGYRRACPPTATTRRICSRRSCSPAWGLLSASSP